MRFASLVVVATVMLAASSARGADLATGLVGYWRLDETSTAGAARDSSPTGANGVYVNAPMPVTAVPNVTYADPGSVLLSRASMQAVRVQNVPPALKPAAVTLAAWFRVRMTVTNQGSGHGFSDIVSVGDQTLVRVYADKVEASKRVPNDWAAVDADVNPGTNVWHHLAATMDGTRITLYFDGASVGSLADARAITYDQGPDLWIGRHGSGTMMRDFDGNIDEAAIWSRVLSATEIAALASGAQPGTGGGAPPDAGAGGSGGAGGAGGAAGTGGAGAGGAGGAGVGGAGGAAGAGGAGGAGVGGAGGAAGAAGAGGVGTGGSGATGAGGVTGTGGAAGAAGSSPDAAAPSDATAPTDGTDGQDVGAPAADAGAPSDDTAPSDGAPAARDANLPADASPGADAAPTGSGGASGSGGSGAEPADARTDQGSQYRTDGSRPPAPPGSAGCGCTTAPGASWSGLLLFALVLARRRVRAKSGPRS